MLTKFNTAQYQDTFRYNWEFEQYNDKQEFWLELDYFINRDSFISRIPVNAQSGADFAHSPSLDFDITAENGEKIFRNVSAERLATICARGYKLLNETAETANADEDILKITETYGYVPNKTFTRRTGGIYTQYGRQDPDGARTSRVVKLGGRYDAARERFYFKLNDGELSYYAVGDEVALSGFGHGQNYNFTCPLTVVEDITADNLIGIKGVGLTFAVSGGTRDIHTTFLFFNDADYGWTGYVAKTVSISQPRNSFMNVREDITYHQSLPLVVDKFCPKTQQGGETDTFSTVTLPTISEWKTKVANGDWVAVIDSEIENVHSLYKRTIKYVKCR